MNCRLIVALLSVALFCSSMPVAAEEESWTDRINLKGDLRLRYEGIDEEDGGNRDRM
jgi:hypothetical protein